mgnify:CR=1 FL=1
MARVPPDIVLLSALNATHFGLADHAEIAAQEIGPRMIRDKST